MSPETPQQQSGGCLSFSQAGEEPLHRNLLQQKTEEPGCEHCCSAWVLLQSWLLLPRICKEEGRRNLQSPHAPGEIPSAESVLDVDAETPTPASLLQIIWQGDNQPSPRGAQSCYNSIRAVLAPISKAFCITLCSRLTGKGPLGPLWSKAQQTPSYLVCSGKQKSSKATSCAHLGSGRMDCA